jgi:hypothetical protein
MARNILAVASQRSVRRISSGLKGARVLHRERGRHRSTGSRPRARKAVFLHGYYGCGKSQGKHNLCHSPARRARTLNKTEDLLFYLLDYRSNILEQ